MKSTENSSILLSLEACSKRFILFQLVYLCGEIWILHEMNKLFNRIKLSTNSALTFVYDFNCSNDLPRTIKLNMMHNKVFYSGYLIAFKKICS